VEEIRERRPDAVTFGWVKVHVGTRGNEFVVQQSKVEAALLEEWRGPRMVRMVAEGGLR